MVLNIFLIGKISPFRCWLLPLLLRLAQIFVHLPLLLLVLMRRANDGSIGGHWSFQRAVLLYGFLTEALLQLLLGLWYYRITKEDQQNDDGNWLREASGWWETKDRALWSHRCLLPFCTGMPFPIIAKRLFMLSHGAIRLSTNVASPFRNRTRRSDSIEYASVESR